MDRIARIAYRIASGLSECVNLKHANGQLYNAVKRFTSSSYPDDGTYSEVEDALDALRGIGVEVGAMKGSLKGHGDSSVVTYDCSFDGGEGKVRFTTQVTVSRFGSSDGSKYDFTMGFWPAEGEEQAYEDSVAPCKDKALYAKKDARDIQNYLIGKVTGLQGYRKTGTDGYIMTGRELSSLLSDELGMEFVDERPVSRRESLCSPYDDFDCYEGDVWKGTPDMMHKREDTVWRYRNIDGRTVWVYSHISVDAAGTAVDPWSRYESTIYFTVIFRKHEGWK